MYMLATGIVYAVLLSGGALSHAVGRHDRAPAVMPVVVALDWAIDPPRMHLERADPALDGCRCSYRLHADPRRGGRLVSLLLRQPHESGGYRAWRDGLAIGAGMIALIVAPWVGNRRGAAMGASRLPRLGPARIGRSAAPLLVSSTAQRLAELAHALAERARELGQTLGTEHDQRDRGEEHDGRGSRFPCLTG